MLNKLSKLLFEDDDDDYFDDDDEVVESPVKVSNPVKIAPKKAIVEEPVNMPEPPMPEELVQEAAPKKVTRIDVTNEIPTATKVQETPKPKKTLGITVDEEVKKPVSTPKVVKPTTSKKAKPKKPVAKSSGYDFKPVISPIFGVDEKDLNALKTTTKKVATVTEEPEEGNITPVISPIYGSTMKSEVAYEPTSETPTSQEAPKPVVEKNTQVEEPVPEFSLDDILKVRDEEYDDADLGNTAPLFPDLTLPEDPEELDSLEDTDQTLVFDKPLSK